MPTNLDRYKSDLEKLLKLGSSMELDLTLRHFAEKRKLDKDEKKVADALSGAFERDYQKWYTEALAVIAQLIPARLSEFEQLYKGDGKRREINATTYHIQDWLNGIRAGTRGPIGDKLYDDFAIVVMRFKTQMQILHVVEARFESVLFDIKQLVQADLFDSELD